MSEAIITVENLGKKYQIVHEKSGRGSATLRETLTNSASGLVRALIPGGKNRNGNESGGQPRREEFWALRNVSFEVKQGEVVGIIGRNGAGKSTLLKLLSRITEPTEGRVRLRGRVASLLEVGTGFHPELTGRENIFLNGAILGMGRDEIKRKFDEIVDFAGTEKFLDTPVKRYSSGMYVRLAFAVAAHLDPEILVVDEVLSVGDAEFQKKCLGKMEDVSSKEGRTVLFVSHSMSAITQLCGRGILLRGGTLVLDGDVSNVASAYLNDASESSIGEFDLSSHPGRSRESYPAIRKIRLYGASNGSSAQLYPDEECFVEIDYQLPEQRFGLRWAIAIEDYLGRRVMTFGSYFQQSAVAQVPGSGTLKCSLGALGLGPGRYLLSVSVATKEHGMIDSIDNAAWFEIVWNNYYENSEPYYQVYGPVLRRSRWETVDGK
jgi:lipopolysaccharide transport system ATP-binding protein